MKQTTLGLLAAMAFVLPSIVSAGVCPDITNCTLNFDVKNDAAFTLPSSAAGSYGTINLLLQSDKTILASISLANNYGLIITGAGSHYGVAFNTNVPINSTSSPAYKFSGFTSSSPSGTYGDVTTPVTATNGGVHFNALGYFDVGAITSVDYPGPGNDKQFASQFVSFTITKTSPTGGFTDVNELVQSNGPIAGTNIYFTADVIQKDTKDANGKTIKSTTGVIGATSLAPNPITLSSVPEPTSYLSVLGLGFAFMLWKRNRSNDKA